MSRDQISQAVRALVAEHFARPLTDITEATDFHNDLRGDSLDAIEITFALELAFDLEIGDDDAERIKTVSDAVDYLVRSLPAAVAA